MKPTIHRETHFFEPALRDPTTLRRKAALARRAAGFRTESGQAADRQLIALALRLEQRANELENRAARGAI